mmetsp:Transcript_1719/g.3605  ORF Transcript_1719/g.3605 Transcript_1719/m.3605 type:complete len:257 (+) Transcript_1719:79-849(+)
MERAWIAEEPARLHAASKRRWSRIANPAPRESAGAARARQTALATRTHRLAQSIARGDLGRLEALYALGLNLNARLKSHGFDARGLTPLQAACLTGRAEVVRWLLVRGGRPCAKSEAGTTALEVVRAAQTTGSLAATDADTVVSLLLSHQAARSVSSRRVAVARKQGCSPTPECAALVQRALAVRPYTTTSSSSGVNHLMGNPVGTQGRRRQGLSRFYHEPTLDPMDEERQRQQQAKRVRQLRHFSFHSFLGRRLV